MKTLRCAAVALLILALPAAGIRAQEPTLEGKSVLELHAGMWTGASVTNEVGASGVRASADVNSFVGGLLYAYGLRENVAVTVSAGVLSAGANVRVGAGTVSEESGTVVPLLLGLRYYVPSPKPGAKVRPFLSAAAGPYVGNGQSVRIASTVVEEAHTEAAFGGRFGGGIDAHLGQRFKLIVNVGYNVMTDFSTPVTGRRSFNGGDFSAGVGYTF